MARRPLSHDIALSDAELEHFLKGYGARIVRYTSLASFRSIQTLFRAHGRCNFVVLFNESATAEEGHWTVLLDRGAGVYELFDSLAGGNFKGPDGINQTLGVHTHALSRLIERSAEGTRLTVSETALQARTTATCGRWVCNRILAMRMNNKQYENTARAAARAWRSADEWVIAATALPMPQ